MKKSREGEGDGEGDTKYTAINRLGQSRCYTGGKSSPP